MGQREVYAAMKKNKKKKWWTSKELSKCIGLAQSTVTMNLAKLRNGSNPSVEMKIFGTCHRDTKYRLVR